MSGTKERMAEVFKELVCRKSFHKITIRDITKECQMTRENFYYHFRDKYDILGWIFEHEIVDNLPGESVDFEKWIGCMVHLVLKDYKFYHKVLKDLEYRQARYYLYPIFEKRIRLWVRELFDDSIWPMREEKENFTTQFFTNAFAGYCLNYVIDHEECNYKLVERNLQFLFHQFLNYAEDEMPKTAAFSNF